MLTNTNVLLVVSPLKKKKMGCPFGRKNNPKGLLKPKPHMHKQDERKSRRKKPYMIKVSPSMGTVAEEQAIVFVPFDEGTWGYSETFADGEA